MGSAILERVLPAVNALSQMPSVANRLQCRPIWPPADRVAVFATAKPIVKDKRAGAGSCYPNPEPSGCLSALDGRPCKIPDPIAFLEGIGSRLMTSSLNFSGAI